MHVAVPTSSSQMSKDHAAGIRCRRGVSLWFRRRSAMWKNGNNETNKTNKCVGFHLFFRRTSTSRRVAHTDVTKCVELSRMARVLNTVLARPAAQSSRSESGYWDVRIPPLRLIILDSFWPSSSGPGHVQQRLFPSPPRGHEAEGSPAALPVSTRAEPDASDCGPNLTSPLRVQGNIFLSENTRTCLERCAILTIPKERTWVGGERGGRCNNIPCNCPNQQ